MKNWAILGGILALILILAFATNEFSGKKQSYNDPKVTFTEMEEPKLTQQGKSKFWAWDRELRRGLDLVDNDWEELWQNTLTDFSQGYIDAQTVIYNLKELESRLIEDEMIFKEAKVPPEIPNNLQATAEVAKDAYARWARERRQSCEKYRLALMNDEVTQQTIQRTITAIENADASVIQGNTFLADLEKKIGGR